MMSILLNKLTHYWLQSVRLCFVRSAESSGFMLVYGHNIEVTEIMIDTIYTVAAPVLRGVPPSIDCSNLKTP